MKIVTKNYSLKNGKRSYLVYLKDENDNSLVYSEKKIELKKKMILVKNME